MKRLINVGVIILLAFVAVLSGCSKTNTNTSAATTIPVLSSNTTVESTTVKSEPSEASFELLRDELGVDLTVPESATDIHYGIATLEDGRTVGQVDYKIGEYQVHMRAYNYGDIDIDSMFPEDLDNLVNLSELDHTFNATGGGFEAFHLNGNGTVSGSFNTSSDGYGRLDFIYREQTTVYSLWVDFGSTEINMPQLYSGFIVFVDSEI